MKTGVSSALALGSSVLVVTETTKWGCIRELCTIVDEWSAITARDKALAPPTIGRRASTASLRCPGSREARSGEGACDTNGLMRQDHPQYDAG